MKEQDNKPEVVAAANCFKACVFQKIMSLLHKDRANPCKWLNCGSLPRA